MDMWMTWEIGPTALVLAAVALAFVLSMPLSRAAYRLPRVLDSQIRVQASQTHRLYRAGFWLAALIMAILCAWRFGSTPATVAAIVYVLILRSEEHTSELQSLMRISYAVFCLK